MTVVIEKQKFTLAFGPEQVSWGMDGPALDRYERNGARVEVQPGHDEKTGDSVLNVYIAARGNIASATFPSRYDVSFSRQLFREDERNATDAADQLLAIIDIRAAAVLAKSKIEKKIAWPRFAAAVATLDAARLENSLLSGLHDDLKAVTSLKGGVVDTHALRRFDDELRQRANTAAGQALVASRHIKTEFNIVKGGTVRLIDDCLDRLQPDLSVIDANLSLLRRDFLLETKWRDVSRGLLSVSDKLAALPKEFKGFNDDLGARIRAQLVALKAD